MPSALRKEDAGYVGADYTSTAPARRGGREGVPQLHELPLVKPRSGVQEQVESRRNAEVRPREHYSVFPALLMAVAAVVAVLIIGGYSELDGIYAQTVQAREELAALQQEEVRLLAQYEEVFDRAALESAVLAAGSSRLTEARSEQKIYVDLSEPDNAVVYDQSGGGLLEALKDFWGMLQS